MDTHGRKGASVNTHVAIVLAHEEPFKIGSVIVRPATRELEFGGRNSILEPRVMQVLVALWRAGGNVVSKDDLVERCWNGRIVGDDAINRVMSRLRHNAECDAGGEFRVETVTRVGYRLRSGEPGEPTGEAEGAAGGGEIDRRGLIAAGAVLAVAGAGGLTWRLTRPAQGEGAEIERIARAAQGELLQGSFEQEANALGRLEQAVSSHPRSGRLRGLLAMGYMCHAMKLPRAESDRYRAMSENVAKQALAIDPDNAEAQSLPLITTSMINDWIGYERMSARLLARHPDNFFTDILVAGFLTNVGRRREALALYDRALSTFPEAPAPSFCRALTLDDLGRLSQAQEAIERAYRLWPKNTGVWFVRLYLLGYGGRTAEALAMTDDPNNWPVGVNKENQEMTRAQIAALGDRSPATVAEAVRRTMALATRGTGFAENAIIFTGTLGLVEEFFAVAERYFFDPAILNGPRFSQEQRVYSPHFQRYTHILFRRTLGAVWRDPRFDRLLERLGLVNYWNRMGITPDFRTA